MEPDKKIIATNHYGYPQEKNFLSLPLQHYRFIKSFDRHKLVSFLKFRLTGKIDHFHLNSHHRLIRGNISLFHFFNSISSGKIPWITTFETILPRWGAVTQKQLEKGIMMMADSSCKQLIAMSQCALDMQKSMLEEKYSSVKNDILSKSIVLHPAQLIPAPSIIKKPADTLEFCFAGNDFFRKGGDVMLQVFAPLLEKNSHLRLTIISTLSWGDYASRSTRSDYENALQLIHRFPLQIKLLSRIPNNRVMEVFGRSHVSLLPTLADSYGYSVLESQAASCPVISTDIRALPEINDTSSGWLLNMPKDHLGEGLIKSENDRFSFKKQLKEQLENAIFEIIQNPDSISAKAHASVERIKSKHNPKTTASVLESIYDQALL